MPKVNNIRYITITGSTSIGLEVKETKELYYLNAVSTDTGMTITVGLNAGEIPFEGLEYEFVYEGPVDFTILPGPTFTIFGTTLTTDQLLKQVLYIKAVYVSGSWRVEVREHCCNSIISGSRLEDNSIDLGLKGIVNSLTLDKLETQSDASIIVYSRGNASARTPSDWSLVYSDGVNTDFISLGTSGDVSFVSPGKLIINPGVITADKLAFSFTSYLTLKRTLTPAELGALDTTPITLIGSVTGKQIVPISVYGRINPVSLAATTTVPVEVGFSTRGVFSFSTTFINSSSSKIEYATRVSNLINQEEDLTIFANGTITEGDGTLDVYIIYTLIDL